MLHFQTLPPGALDLLTALHSHEGLQPFALAGGTSLALRFGHRTSVDLDFFTHEGFENETLAQSLKGTFDFDERRRGPTGVTGFINEVKVDFVKYPYPPRHPPETIDGIRLVSLPDVIAMKLSAITNRGAKKDFYDLKTLIDQFGLEALIGHYRVKFSGTDPMMLLRSVTYFDDAEGDKDPHSLEGVTWNQVKDRIRSAAREMLR